MLSNLPIILVVEDDEFIQDLIARYLSSLNVEIYFASDGIEGVKMYEELMKIGKRPDIVIMDIGLPFRDGIEATREIMKMDKDAVIYGFTAFYGTEKAEALLNEGAKAVIPRSVGFEKFREIIKEAIYGRAVIH